MGTTLTYCPPLKIKQKNPLRQCYVYTDCVSGYDIDISKNYYIIVTLSLDKAIAIMEKRFYQFLAGTQLKEPDKNKIKNIFRDNVANGKYSFHFRDNRIPAEPQYFGKIHIRSLLYEPVQYIGGYPAKPKTKLYRTIRERK